MATQMEEEERVVATTEDDSECALFRNISHDSHDSCNALVPYRGDSYLELSWEADSAWSLRMLQLMIDNARLKMLMAWCSTLGGAHSSLGEHSQAHAEEAGVISGRQLSLAVGLRDPLLATRCKLYLAYSLLQQGRLRKASKIIREQYKYITKEAIIKDTKLETMCMAAWERLKYLRRQLKGVDVSQRTEQPPVNT